MKEVEEGADKGKVGLKRRG